MQNDIVVDVIDDAFADARLTDEMRRVLPSEQMAAAESFCAEHHITLAELIEHVASMPGGFFDQHNIPIEPIANLPATVGRPITMFLAGILNAARTME